MLYKNCLYCPYNYICFLNNNSANYFRLPPQNQVYIETKRIEAREEYIIEHLRIPVFKNMENKDIQKKINNSIESDILEFKKQMEEAAKEAYERAKREGREFEPYVISTIYELTYNEDDIVSISIIYHEYINKANYYIRTAYNYNIESGKSLSIGDIFKESVDYISILNKAVRNYIQRNPQSFAPDALEEFEGIKIDQPFFLENKSIAMFFGFHQIAPRAAEIPIIKVPFSDLARYVKPEFLN